MGDVFADRAWREADTIFVVLDFLGAADAHFLLLIRALLGSLPVLSE
jgi:hypothetical protein